MLAGAYGSEIFGGLYPCEMCWWQRYAHFAGLGLALISLLLRKAPDRGRSFVWLAALAILTSGGIGAYHAGVEAGRVRRIYHLHLDRKRRLSTEELLKQVMAAPIVRCDEIQWSFLGISMAGWNAILSILARVVDLMAEPQTTPRARA